MNKFLVPAVAAALLSIAACGPDPLPAPANTSPGHAPSSAAPELRYQVDAARGRVWWLTREGVFFHDANAPARTAVALKDWTFAEPSYACLPDLAIGPRGEVVVTSNVLPTLWRIDPDTLAVTSHAIALDADNDKDVGFSGLVYSAAHSAFFAVSEAHGSLWRIDPHLARAQKVALSEPVTSACGLALRAPTARHRADGRVALCVRSGDEGRNIDLSPDQRSAYVRDLPCTDFPLQMSRLSLSGR